MYNKEEKLLRDLSTETGSYLFFQLFRIIINTMPKTVQSKQTMIKIVRNYYRKNLIELANIDDFDKNYLGINAVSWYMKESFLFK